MSNIYILENENKKLQQKLDIAIKTLKEYGNKDWWRDATDDFNNVYIDGAFDDYGYKLAQQALAKIEEIK